MASYNHVTLMGNVVAPLELRRLPSGMAVTEIRLAVNERYKDKSGEWQEKAVYVDVVVWEKQAENCAKYLDKGSPVFVEGKLQMDEWTAKDGEKRSKLRVKAQSVQFLGSAKRTANTPNVEQEVGNYHTGREVDKTQYGEPHDDDDVPF